jgi:hypothetical protein
MRGRQMIVTTAMPDERCSRRRLRGAHGRFMTPERSDRCHDTGRSKEKEPTFHTTQARPTRATRFRNGLIQHALTN